MPVKSAKQFRLMQAAAHGKSSIGPSPKVAREFLAKSPKKEKSIFAKEKK
jgi:hypothetical protein